MYKTSRYAHTPTLTECTQTKTHTCVTDTMETILAKIDPHTLLSVANWQNLLTAKHTSSSPVKRNISLPSGFNV